MKKIYFLLNKKTLLLNFSEGFRLLFPYTAIHLEKREPFSGRPAGFHNNISGQEIGKMRIKAPFTMIELLVVIAMIAILAAMLLPALNTAREKARSIACISNMKHFGLAFSSYNNDFNDFFPPVNMKDNGWSPTVPDLGETAWTWAWEFRRSQYVPDTKMFICWSVAAKVPAMKQQMEELIGAYRNLPNRYNRTTYGYNADYIGSSNSVGEPAWMPAKIRQLKKPGETILLAETPSSYKLNSPGSTWASNLINVHSNICNVLWADNHASGEVNAEQRIAAKTAVSSSQRKYFSR